MVRSVYDSKILNMQLDEFIKNNNNLLNNNNILLGDAGLIDCDRGKK